MHVLVEMLLYPWSNKMVCGPATYTVLLIIGLLVVAGIFNTLFVSVMERLREFGILIAVGFPPSPR